MKKFKYYILTSSSNEYLLERHISEEWSNIPKEDVVVVINTLDDIAEKKCAEWCESKEIEYHITESDGTPARGKNSVIELFLESDNEYMVMVDGDDFITPHGTVFFSELAKMDSPPDAITMKNQWGSVIKPEAVAEKYQTDSKGHLQATYYRPFTVDDWDDFLPNFISGLVTNLTLRQNVEYDKAIKYTAWSEQYYTKQKTYSEPNEVHCRITWLSKKAVKSHRFLEDHRIGEDTLFYYKLKNDAINGKLDFKVHNEVPFCTYVYDQVSNPGSIVATTTQGGRYMDWMEGFNAKIDEYESSGILHANKSLPIIQVKYPDDYTPYVNLIK